MRKIHLLISRIPLRRQQQFIASAVDATIRQLFPAKYAGLCHVYAIVGSNVLSIVLGHHYIPVAGLGVIDAGGGCFLEMLDNAAFNRERGGSFHCWIESADLAEIELIDFTFRHNAVYAATQGIKWRNKGKAYLWGLKSDLLLDVDQSKLPKVFPDGKVWFQKTDEGAIFIKKHIAEHMNAHIKITRHVLKRLSLELEIFLAKKDLS
ncbi:MAG: hypothetical protein LLG15_11340 [Betaproteobacteria bacterium]|nr:hypothetical protein [Betaproteobacteria bacterium]